MSTDFFNNFSPRFSMFQIFSSSLCSLERKHQFYTQNETRKRTGLDTKKYRNYLYFDDQFVMPSPLATGKDGLANHLLCPIYVFMT